MPNWQPNWNDVQWDFNAANNAIKHLEKTAAELQYLALRRTTAAESATLFWYGGYRRQFDTYLNEMLLRSNALIGKLKNSAEQIRQANAAAEAEQKQREYERSLWLEQKRAEDESEGNK